MTEENTPDGIVPAVSDSLLTPAQAASYIGVTGRTLTRWRIEGKIAPAGKTAGGHFRYHVRDCRKIKNEGLGEVNAAGGVTGTFHGTRPQDKEVQVDADHPMFN